MEGVENTGGFYFGLQKGTAEYWDGSEADTETDNSWGTWNIVYNPKEAERISYNADITPIMGEGACWL